MDMDTTHAIILLRSKVNYGSEAPTVADTILLNAAAHLEYRDPEFCGLCGARKPYDRSCDCFDNNCQ